MQIEYGTVTVHEGYKNGSVVSRTRVCEQSIPVRNQADLLNRILQELDKLKEFDTVEFKVHADKHTHIPYRMTVVSEEKL